MYCVFRLCQINYYHTIANNAQRVMSRGRARTHDHRISSQRLTLSRYTARQINKVVNTDIFTKNEMHQFTTYNESFSKKTI